MSHLAMIAFTLSPASLKSSPSMPSMSFCEMYPSFCSSNARKACRIAAELLAIRLVLIRPMNSL